MPIPRYDTGHAVSDGLKLAYRRFGQKGATPVLIVHGLSYFSYDWIDVAASLSRDREVVAMDMRGFGDSDWSPTREYGLPALAADVIAVVDHLGWDRCILVGHSMGGRVCLCAAAWHPQRIGGLVCVDFAPDVAAEGRRNVAQRIGMQPDTFDSVNHALQYHGFGDPARVDTATRARYAAFLKPVAGGFALKRDLHYRDNFRAVLEGGKPAPVNVDLWALLAALPQSPLFLRGTRSDMFAPETMDKIRTANPRAQVIEIEGSHDLVGDNPTDLTNAIRTYLADPANTR